MNFSDQYTFDFLGYIHYFYFKNNVFKRDFFFIFPLQTLQTGLLAVNANSVAYEQVLHMSKHWNPKFKRLRTLKVIKVELPDFQEKPGDITPEEGRSRMKERGILPPRPWNERAFVMSTVR